MKPTLWKQLQACAAVSTPAKFPGDTVALFAPRDNIPLALQTLVESAKTSLILEMFTYCDATIHALLKAKAAMVQATFDASQYREIPAMRLLVDDLAAAGASVAKGNSEHGRIVHRKVLIVDSLYVVNGSTNWTSEGERLEDNELVIRRNAPLAAWYEWMLNANHQRLAQAAVAAA